MLIRRSVSTARQLESAKNRSEDGSHSAPAWNNPNSATLKAIGRLTPRQREVLSIMLQGKCNKEICRTLNLAQPTVKNHVTAILRALDVTSRTEAVIEVIRAQALTARYQTVLTTYSGYVPVSMPLTCR